MKKGSLKMTKITKEQQQELEALKAKAKEAIEEYAKKFDEILEQIEIYIDERSEKWHESSRVDDYNIWLSDIEYKQSEIENILHELDDIDFEDIITPTNSAL